MKAPAKAGPSVWSSLKEYSFRVLRIIQVEPWICTQLVERQHGDPSSFHALSYAWGNEGQTWNISRVGIAVALTAHLHEAIRCIFNLYGSLDLVVDAICIDHRMLRKRRNKLPLCTRCIRMRQMY
jgi:hypothetical protein